jgi:hypothetical protein
METALAKLVAGLVSYGPGFAVAAIFIVFYLLERKKSEEAAKALMELAVESIKADMEHTKAYATLEKAFNAAIEALTARRD